MVLSVTFVHGEVEFNSSQSKTPATLPNALRSSESA